MKHPFRIAELTFLGVRREASAYSCLARTCIYIYILTCVIIMHTCGTVYPLNGRSFIKNRVFHTLPIFIG